MPWLHEVEPARAGVRAGERRRGDPRHPFFEGLRSRQPEQLAGSFAGEPVLEDPRHRCRIYDLMFAGGGGIPLELCTVTDDGVACAIEYNCTRWGSDPVPPQAGIAVYERGESGRLAAARIYDDVAPPESSDSSMREHV